MRNLSNLSAKNQAYKGLILVCLSLALVSATTMAKTKQHGSYIGTPSEPSGQKINPEPENQLGAYITFGQTMATFLKPRTALPSRWMSLRRVDLNICATNSGTRVWKVCDATGVH